MSKNTLKHLAIIMDGNGRWAKSRGEKRVKGHEKGAETIRDITKFCSTIPSLESVTFYAFSTENWKRPKLEIEFLMKMLSNYLKNELKTYHKYGIRLRVIGEISAFSTKLQKQIEETQELTKEHTNLTQVLALNYGGRAEIVKSVNKLIYEGKTTITEGDISSSLQTPYENIDLLIRTSGEERVSNFLLWQISYSELYFSSTLWPDFTPKELEKIVDIYKDRLRRFGGI